MTLILSEFPELASFEAKGLLPSAENEEALRQKLTTFRDTLKTRVDADVKETFKGAGAGGAGKGDGKDMNMNKDQLYNRLTALAGRQDQASRDEYEKLMALWLQPEQ